MQIKKEKIMAQKILLRIAEISNQIEKLSNEQSLLKARLKESLSHDIMKLLNQKNALHDDFETLVGGILSVIDTLKKEDSDAIQHKNNWKKMGSNYLRSDKKKKIKKDAQKNKVVDEIRDENSDKNLNEKAA
jgi:hypothetical protein